MKKEIERLRKENKVQKDELNQICGEVMILREEIERLRKDERVQNDELKKKGTICGQVLMLREEIERVSEENMVQKDHLKQKDQEKQARCPLVFSDDELNAAPRRMDMPDKGQNSRPRVVPKEEMLARN